MRVSVVTGCNGGMGRAICAALKSAGDRVVGIDRGGTESGSGSEAPDLFLACDLAEAGEVRQALDALAGEKPIGCLVNCAGLYEKKTIFELTLEDFDRTTCQWSA